MVDGRVKGICGLHNLQMYINELHNKWYWKYFYFEYEVVKKWFQRLKGGIIQISNFPFCQAQFKYLILKKLLKLLFPCSISLLELAITIIPYWTILILSLTATKLILSQMLFWKSFCVMYKPFLWFFFDFLLLIF